MNAHNEEWKHGDMVTDEEEKEMNEYNRRADERYHRQLKLNLVIMGCMLIIFVMSIIS